jgi:hypothetical protein
MLAEIGQWGDRERKRLGLDMPLRRVSVCLDETWLDLMVLVGMEPQSGFLLLEHKSDKRDAETWHPLLDKAKDGLNLVIHLVTSDDAKGLLRLSLHLLGVPHLSDVFHGQHELFKGLLPPLRAKLSAAQAKLEQSRKQAKELMVQRDRYQGRPRGRGRPQNWKAQVDRAMVEVAQQEQEVESLMEQQVGLRTCVQDIGEVLHPIDPRTGQWQEPGKVADKLTGIFEEIWQRVTELGVSERAGDHVAKAQRLVKSWVEAIEWFHRQVRTRLDEAVLSAEQRALMMTVLIPVAYLEAAMNKAPTTFLRRSIQEVMQKVALPLRDPGGLWQSLSEASRRELEGIARECAGYFQRASSCVEGRNGYLSLRYHHLHSMPKGLLRALTVIHNFVIKREDGSTAAERLTGAKPGDLFEHLVATLPMPSLPRSYKRRPPPNPFRITNSTDSSCAKLCG